ncbi:MAG: HNH endonuclease [Actinomycetota bacterium]
MPLTDAAIAPIPACRSKDRCPCGRPKQAEVRCVLGVLDPQGARRPDEPPSENGYVFEHILVMEELLGRHLSLDETVHHRNGVRDDNSAENLELWVRAQPSGIRVQDAIAWARQILERYEGLG